MVSFWEVKHIIVGVGGIAEYQPGESVFFCLTRRVEVVEWGE